MLYFHRIIFVYGNIILNYIFNMFNCIVDSYFIIFDKLKEMILN